MSLVTEICHAVRTNNAGSVRRLLILASAEDVNRCIPETGHTALIVAAINGHTEILKILLTDSRVDVNMKNNRGRTALIKASEEGHTEIVKMLLADARVDVNLRDRQCGYTALMIASSKGHTGVVKMLLADSRVNVNMKNKNGRTALNLTRNNKEVKALLSSYVPPLPVVISPPPTIVVSAPQLNTYPQAPISSTVPESEPSWLAARLLKDGVDAQLIKECEHALVAKEGFVTESDFAEAEDVDAAYLRSIGITGKGIQNRLLKLHKELSATQNAHTSVVTVGGKKNDVIISDHSSVTALTAQMATLTAQLTALAAQVSDLQRQGQQDRQLLVAAGLMDPAGSSREG